MKNFFRAGIGSIALAATQGVSAQSLIDQKTQAEIAKLQVETAKAKVDTEKARIEADNALFGTIRGASGGSATLSGGEKTAEALLLSRASLAGASAKLAGLLPAAGFPASTDIKPVIIWGQTPPSVAQWLIFTQERAKLQKQLKAAQTSWSSATSTKMAFLPAAAGVATLVATVIPLFKTDTTLVGGAVSVEESDVRASLAAALQQARYGTLNTLDISDGAKIAADLLAPVADDYEAVRAAYENNYLVFFEGKLSKSGKSNEIKAAAAKLKAALDAHDSLRDQLLSETGGIVAATIVDRQRQLHSDPDKHPIIYLLNVDAAYTATTKKGLFTGLGGKVPAFASVTTIIDYAIVGKRGETRGTVSCTMANRDMKNLLTLEPHTYTSEGQELCDKPPPKNAEGS